MSRSKVFGKHTDIQTDIITFIIIRYIYIYIQYNPFIPPALGPLQYWRYKEFGVIKGFHISQDVAAGAPMLRGCGSGDKRRSLCAIYPHIRIFFLEKWLY